MEAKLPVFNITISDDEQEGVYAIALVESPAIELDWLAFSKQPQRMDFKANAEKQILAGPFLVPDKPIYRFSEELGEYLVVFTKETIEKLARRFNKQRRLDAMNVEHSEQSAPSFVAENWIIEGEFDKSKNYGFELTEGTWFGLVKVEDSAFWSEYVKTGQVKGFSIEGLLGIERAFSNAITDQVEDLILKFIEANNELGTVAENFSDQQLEWTSLSEEDYEISNQKPNEFGNQITIYKYTGPLDEKTRRFCKSMLTLTENKYLTYFDILRLSDNVAAMNPAAGGKRYSVLKWLGGRNCRHSWQRAKATLNEVISKNLTYSNQKMKTETIKLEAQAALQDGSSIYTPTAFEVDAEVFLVDADGNQTPAPDAEYTLEDGTTLVVAGAKITEVKPAETPIDAGTTDNPTDAVLGAVSLEELASSLDEIRSLVAGIDQRLSALETGADSTVEEELSAIKEQLSTFAKMPGTKFSSVANTAKVKTAEERFTENVERLKNLHSKSHN